MKRVIKIVIMVLVFGFAVVLASSCCGIQTVAYADGYELYLINNPLDISLYQYSTNGVDYYDISGSLTDFVDTFYNGITHTEPLQLFIGSEGVPLVTAETITISKDTEGYIYLENDFASTVPLQEFNRDVTIAMRSAIILSADADLTVNQALITTDGARAITQRSTGTLTVNGLSDSTVIHSINRAVPTYGGTIFVDYVASALPAYVQNGGSILNSADHAYSSAILNYSNRDLYINGGNVVSTPSGNPFAEYGMGETAAIRNVSDGVIYISETPGNPTVIASANASVYYMGVIHLSGVATGKTTLDISGGTIINYNQNSTYAKRCYAIYTVNPNNISISDATVTNMGGYAVNNAGQGDITIQNSTIDNSAMSFNIPAIYMPGGVLDIAESTVSSAAYYAAAIQADTGNVYLDNATIEGASDTYGCLHLGSGNLRVTDTVLVNESQVKMYFSAAENNLLFDDFSIIGNFNVNIKMIDDDISTPTDQKSYSIEAVDNTYSDKYFRAWYEDSAHYSDSAEITAASIPIGALLRIHVENVYQFIQDPDMQHGSLFAHTPIKTFKGLTVNLVFRPDTAYYLHEAYYYDATEQKVGIYLHSGDNYTATPYIEAVMPEGDHTVFADFRPVPITVGVNDVIATYGDNIRLWANIN
ncbi:MAG: hypothetical protein PHI19_08245, partial [Clostridia bacterium]|nr:hypothetical protein [Clostridia bacterium]